jgi:putative tricarboxylic transport membrane protein
MRRVDIGFGAFVLAVGVLVFTQAIGLTFYRESVPGPGFMPTLLAIALALSGAALIGTRLRGTDAKFGQVKLPAATPARKVLGVAAAVFLGVLALTVIGFVPAMILLVGALLLGVEGRRTVPAVLAVFLLPIAVYLVFEELLAVPLPNGPLGV